MIARILEDNDNMLWNTNVVIIILVWTQGYGNIAVGV